MYLNNGTRFFHNISKENIFVIDKLIYENEDCKDVNNVCEERDKSIVIIIMKAMSYFAKILLNSCSKSKCGDIVNARLSQKVCFLTFFHIIK